MGLSSVSLVQLAPKATTLGEMMQKNGHYAVQDHSRSPVSVAINSLYASSYEQTIHTSYQTPFPRYYRVLVKFSLPSLLCHSLT